MGVKVVLDSRIHISSVLGHLRPLMIGPREAKKCFWVLKVCIHGSYEHVCAVLHHLHVQALGEGLGGGVDVSEHCVALPPAHQSDDVLVGPHKEECHCPTHMGRWCAYIVSLKPALGPAVHIMVHMLVGE